MQIDDFNFNLPKELIAQYPLPQRSASRLMCLNKTNGVISHYNFADLSSLLLPTDLLVFNDTRVIPARLMVRKSTGGKVEILVERFLNERQMLVQLGANKPIKIGTELYLTDTLGFIVTGRQEDFFILESKDHPILDMVKQYGHMPLPPYIERSDEFLDQERYQTIFATKEGAVAAPTAGLHFDERIFSELKQRKIEMAFLTLHVGAGTFQALRVADITQHKMHTEYCEISVTTCEQINRARDQKRRIVAVGTTCARALETAAQSGKLLPFNGETNIFIYPGYKFQVVDALITNFHLPKSTLLMLVCAFAGYANVMHAYQVAVAEKYRFFSYGDAMLLG